MIYLCLLMTIVIHSFVGSHVISSTTELTTIDSTTAVNQSSDESNLPIDYVLTPEDHEDAKDGDLNKRDKKSPYYRNQPNMMYMSASEPVEFYQQPDMNDNFEPIVGRPHLLERQNQRLINVPQQRSSLRNRVANDLYGRSRNLPTHSHSRLLRSEEPTLGSVYNPSAALYSEQAHQAHEYSAPPQQQYQPQAPQQQYQPQAPQQQYQPQAPQQHYHPQAPQQHYHPQAPQQHYHPQAPQQQYQPQAPEPQYQPQAPPPSYEQHVHSYSYQPPQSSCGSNVLIGCQPQVQHVPCSSQYEAQPLQPYEIPYIRAAPIHSGLTSVHNPAEQSPPMQHHQVMHHQIPNAAQASKPSTSNVGSTVQNGAVNTNEVAANTVNEPQTETADKIKLNTDLAATTDDVKSQENSTDMKSATKEENQNNLDNTSNAKPISPTTDNAPITNENTSKNEQIDKLKLFQEMAAEKLKQSQSMLAEALRSDAAQVQPSQMQQQSHPAQIVPVPSFTQPQSMTFSNTVDPMSLSNVPGGRPIRSEFRNSVW